jgi:hypothetical protein
MLETTRDFFSDAYHHRLDDPVMLEILLVFTGISDPIPPGQALHDFHKLTAQQRNYICCVMLERDQDPATWAEMWDRLESEAFE